MLIYSSKHRFFQFSFSQPQLKIDVSGQKLLIAPFRLPNARVSCFLKIRVYLSAVLLIDARQINLDGLRPTCEPYRVVIITFFLELFLFFILWISSCPSEVTGVQ